MRSAFKKGLLWIISLLIIVLIVDYYFLFDNSIDDLDRLNLILNPLNVLFSGLAFAGIIMTVYMQKEELALQRQELFETRIELKRTADSQEKSENALTRQANNLKISAELSALNTLINYYTEQSKYLKSNSVLDPKSFENVNIKISKYLKRIEEIVDAKNSILNE